MLVPLEWRKGMEVLERALTKLSKCKEKGVDAMLTPEEVSAVLGVDVRTLANWRWKGKGPGYIKVGKLVRYPASAIIEYMGNCRRKSWL